MEEPELHLEADQPDAVGPAKAEKLVGMEPVQGLCPSCGMSVFSQDHFISCIRGQAGDGGSQMVERIPEIGPGIKIGGQTSQMVETVPRAGENVPRSELLLTGPEVVFVGYGED